MVEAIPKTHMGFIPHLTVKNARNAIEFYKKAFGAEEKSAAPRPSDKKIMHAEMHLNGYPFFLNDDFPEMSGGKPNHPGALGGSPVTIHHYVKNCDAVVDRAKKAGAEVIMGPDDMFWGDRYSMVRDPFGHMWSFATHVKDMTPEQMMEAMKAM